MYYTARRVLGYPISSTLGMKASEGHENGVAFQNFVQRRSKVKLPCSSAAYHRNAKSLHVSQSSGVKASEDAGSCPFLRCPFQEKCARKMCTPAQSRQERDTRAQSSRELRGRGVLSSTRRAVTHKSARLGSQCISVSSRVA